MIRNTVSLVLVLLLSVSLVAAQQTPRVGAAEGPASGAPTQPEPAQPHSYDHILQDGTPVKLQLSRTLSSADAKAGQEISFEVADDIDVNGVTVLHRGASAVGVVVEAQAKKRMGRAGKLNFTITSVRLADNEKVALRSVNDASGESRSAGVTQMVLNMPMVAAPFFLLIKGGDSSIPKGTEITAFVDGDVHLDMAKFGADPQPAAGFESTRVVSAQTTRVKIRAILIDKDLNQKPAPRLALTLVHTGDPGAGPMTLRTGFDGLAEADLPAGHYKLSTAQSVDFQDKKFSWSLEFDVAGREISLELSNDNATVAEGPASERPRTVAPAQQPSANGQIVLVRSGGQVVSQDRSSTDVTSAYRSVGNNVVTITLYRKAGKGRKVAGLVEIRGEIEFNSKGIVSGVDGLVRLQLVDAKGKWLAITRRELVAGRAIITTEDGKDYTIFNLGMGDFAGQIEPRLAQGHARGTYEHAAGAGHPDVSTVAPANFSPISDAMTELKTFAAVSSRTHCILRSDADNLWSFELQTPADVIEYSDSPDGIGDPTGSIIYADSTGGLDPFSPTFIVKGEYKRTAGRNVAIMVHQRGRSIRKYQPTAQGTLGPVRPADLQHYVGIGSEVRFPPEWTSIGDLQYRNGGFTVAKEGISFLAGTEVLNATGTFHYENQRWLAGSPKEPEKSLNPANFSTSANESKLAGSEVTKGLVDRTTAAPIQAKPGTAQDGELIKGVQRRLKDLGFLRGLIDGHLGAQTTGAIERFQKARDLPMTGAPDIATVEALGLGTPKSPTPEAPEPKTTTAKEIPSRVQPTTSKRPAPDWLAVEVSHLTLADKAQTYVGDGDDLYAPQSFGGGMSSIVMLRGDNDEAHAYLAGEASSPDGGTLLVVECNFKNISASTQTFYPLEVQLAGKAGALVALGVGSSYPFAKNAVAWDKLRRKVVWSVEKGDTRTLTYVFGVLKDTSVWKLMYDRTEIADLSPKR
jgi:hypothetical protein